MSELKFKIYRAVNSKLEKTPAFKNYHDTMRPPSNVPYVVDNLWEWKRPKNYPNRRYSAFASPKPELALKSANGEIVCEVKFEGKYKLCQVNGYKDSREHPECKELRKLLFKKFGQGWIDGKLNEKEEFGKLWIPCLTKDDMNYLFGSNETLRGIREEVYSNITFWNDVVLIDKDMDLPDPEGELFFQAEGGYYLCDID